MDKITCTKIDKIQSELVEGALKLYKQREYGKFWEAVSSLDIFLSVKEGLGCPVKRRKK